ncbi:MAG: preprotein translocase subunit SecG [Patescibacteria group bacterium]|nr:preprotein translocase subunit SecG [Patescibacteria group bacterium]
MKNIAIVFQIIVSLGLVVLILLQSKGTGLGTAFGGGGEIYRTKRGVEKILYLSTIILAVVFFFSSLVSILIR